MCEEKTPDSGKKKKIKKKEPHKALLHKIQPRHVTSAAIASVRLSGWSRCRNVFHSDAYWLNLELRTSQSSTRGNV